MFTLRKINIANVMVVEKKKMCVEHFKHAKEKVMEIGRA